MGQHNILGTKQLGGITRNLGRRVGESPPIITCVTVIYETLNTNVLLRFHCVLVFSIRAVPKGVFAPILGLL